MVADSNKTAAEEGKIFFLDEFWVHSKIEVIPHHSSTFITIGECLDI